MEMILLAVVAYFFIFGEDVLEILVMEFNRAFGTWLIFVKHWLVIVPGGTITR